MYGIVVPIDPVENSPGTHQSSIPEHHGPENFYYSARDIEIGGQALNATGRLIVQIYSLQSRSYPL